MFVVLGKTRDLLAYGESGPDLLGYRGMAHWVLEAHQIRNLHPSWISELEESEDIR